MRLAAQAKGGFYPTPPRVVDLVAQLLYGARGRARSADTLRILDPCCGAGDALAQFAGLLRDRSAVPVETCGVELHRERAEQAAHVLDRALACDLFATSIANNAFGVLLLNPPYDWDKEDKRVEHAFLTHTTRYLTDGGLLLFIVPKQRLAVSARYLSSHYRDLRCWAFPNPEREVFDQVVLVGRRKGEPSPDPYAEEQVREWAFGEPEEFSYQSLSRLRPAGGSRRRHPLRHPHRGPAGGGGRGQEDRAVGQPGGQGLPLARRGPRTRPLMPLRRGHMAMLVAAGFLDNLVLEADGRRILVKGRTTKEMVLAEETENTEVYRERLRTTVVALDLDGGEITDIAA